VQTDIVDEYIQKIHSCLIHQVMESYFYLPVKVPKPLPPPGGCGGCFSHNWCYVEQSWFYAECSFKAAAIARYRGLS